MKLKRTTREPLPADHAPRVVAHYLALALFLATLAVLAATPPPALEPLEVPVQLEEKPGFWSNLASLVGKLL